MFTRSKDGAWLLRATVAGCPGNGQSLCILAIPERQAHNNFCRIMTIPVPSTPQRFATALQSVAAASVRMLQLPGLPEKGDVSDWKAMGGTAERLQALVDGVTVSAPAASPVPPDTKRFRSDDKGVYVTRSQREGYDRSDLACRSRFLPSPATSMGGLERSSPISQSRSSRANMHPAIRDAGGGRKGMPSKAARHGLSAPARPTFNRSGKGLHLPRGAEPFHPKRELHRVARWRVCVS